MFHFPSTLGGTERWSRRWFMRVPSVSSRTVAMSLSSPLAHCTLCSPSLKKNFNPHTKFYQLRECGASGIILHRASSQATPNTLQRRVSRSKVQALPRSANHFRVHLDDCSRPHKATLNFEAHGSIVRPWPVLGNARSVVRFGGSVLRRKTYKKGKKNARE